ncbi:MAG TPA: CPBP family intramembrane glutamic endopeptidase [Leadbetterella sp.]|nr:CPBP family intramembrane glutamic endopeptidase [Leadbetterella sp.]
MDFLQYLQTTKENKPFTSLLILFAILLTSLALAQIVAGGLMILMSGIELSNIGNIIEVLTSSKNGWWTMMTSQGVASIFTFILPGLLFWYVIEKKQFSDLNFKNLPTLSVFGLVILIQMCFSPFSGYIQSLNEKMQLPASLEWLELLMKNMEESARTLTDFLTKFDSPVQLIVALIVIAVIAGIGEELIFRGLIQRKLMLGFNNYHLAIWVSAILFSGIHMQFYGFFPRMFLGALFGYLYYWSGNIWIPIFAHIFNNALAVLLMDMVNHKKISPEIEKLDTVPLPYVALSVLLFGGLMYFFKKQTSNPQVS